jgi:outer membrane cobalamin receptor
VPSDHNQFTASKGPTIGLDVGRHFTRRVETRLLLSTNASDGGYDDQPDSAADDNLYHSRDRFRRTSADARTNLELPGHWILTVGGALEQEHGRSSNICTFAGFSCATPPIDTVRWDRAVYTQVVGGLGPRGSIVAGARVDDNQRFGRYATYRAGVSVRLGGGLSLRASGGNAFREPTFFENFSTGFAVGNPNLRPEHSRSLEAGVDQAIARGTVTLSATLFDQRFVDMIDYNPSAAPGAPNYANVAGATANGAEVGVRVSAARALAVGVSYTYLHTAVTSAGFDSTSGAALAAGRPLLRRPAHSARLDADYRVGSRGSVGLVVTYVGERQDQGFSTFPFPRVPLPAYARVDCAAALDVVHRRAAAPALAVTLRIDNLLDHAYEEVKNFPARGRTILVGARARLGY